MCKTVLRLAVVVLVIALLSGIAGCKPKAPGDVTPGTKDVATVTGRVVFPTGSVDGYAELIAHAVVYLGDRYVVTGEDDTFRFDNVPVGTHEIFVYDGCYISEVQTITVPEQGLSNVTIEPYLSYVLVGGNNYLIHDTRDLFIAVLISEALGDAYPTVSLSYLKDGNYVDLGTAMFENDYAVDVTNVLQTNIEYTVRFIVNALPRERTFIRKIRAESQIELLEPAQPGPGAVIPITDPTPFFSWTPAMDNGTYEIGLSEPTCTESWYFTGITEPQFQFPDDQPLTLAGQYDLFVSAYRCDIAGHIIEASQLAAMLEFSLE